MAYMPHGLRDPVHKWIPFSEGEKRIINSKPFQRLSRIRQLGMTYLVYPGANHTRYSHSIGAMHLAGKYAMVLSEQNPVSFTPRWVTLVRVAALLHDIAHGPFSHVWDFYVYNTIYTEPKGHDKHRLQLIHTEPLGTLINLMGLTPSDIEAIWSGQDSVGGGIVQGPLGADRMDYLLRDAHHCGTELGHIDVDRIIHNTSVNQRHLVYHPKVHSEIEMFLAGRIWMYQNVYHHNTLFGVMYLLRKAITTAQKPLSLVERTLDLDKFCLMSDDSVLAEIQAKVPEAHGFIEALYSREIPRAVSISRETCDPTRLHMFATPSMTVLDLKKFKEYGIELPQGKFAILNDAVYQKCMKVL
jgi:HD superfamily phosphohydrolase